jgi:hypothetical protein
MLAAAARLPYSVPAIRQLGPPRFCGKDADIRIAYSQTSAHLLVGAILH